MFEQLKTPYSFRKSAQWLWRYLKNGDHSNPTGLKSARVHFEAPEIPQVRLLLIGDLMGLSGKRLVFGEDLKGLAHSCDKVIANLEGPITESKDLVFIKQYNTPDLLEDLDQLASLSRWVFSLANNHIYDYGLKGVEQTIQRIEASSAQHFGTRFRPVHLEKNGALYGVTEWQNRQSPYPISLEAPVFKTSDAEFHILYPHWGEEFCFYPSPSQRNLAKSLLMEYDLIVGHHSHTPQPTEKIEERYCCYSLGNFYIYFDKPMLSRGKVVEVGWSGGNLVLFKESFCQTQFIDKKTLKIDLVGDSVE
ncbi:MAG: CapA family protein [Bdellovibrionales bacterium]|nr:CapA family protein [Bdellovibrionales bacterium]